MKVEPLPQVRQNSIPGVAEQPGPGFNDVLLAKVSRPSYLPSKLSQGTSSALSSPSHNRVHLGTLSEATPTVFSILRQHSEFAKKWEQIISSSVNKEIDYRNLPTGAEVFLDKNSGALIFVSPQEPDNILPKDNPAHANQPPSQSRILVGTIDGHAPTVSHLLQKNATTKTDTWQILKQAVNRQKDFTNIRPGTEIFLDRATGELLWSSPKESTPGTSQASHITPAQYEVAVQDGEQPISLGKISAAAPTVSHLLVGNSTFQSKAWQILFSEVNQHKQFTELRNGTEIFVKPDTGELLWGRELASSAQEAPAAAPAQDSQLLANSAAPAVPPIKDGPPEFSSLLANAVKPYYGRPYKEIDCYGLVVRGLRRMGIKYLGNGGIRDRLVHLANQKGLPPNSYFNGEGLIEATGEKVFSRTFQRVRNAEKEADLLFRDISAKLQKGDILSFSTESSGHTGIISSQGQQWTFINSGDLDNTVSGHDHPAKGVGEENLRAEIKNWLEKAHADRQSLQVTLGRLQEAKLHAAMQQQRPILSSTL